MVKWFCNEAARESFFALVLTMYVDGIRTIEMHNYKDIEPSFRRRIVTHVFPCEIPEAYLIELISVVVQQQGKIR